MTHYFDGFTQDNLTMFPPQQMQMFGMRSIGGSGGIRRA